MSSDRMLAFSDGVIAIIITIMVLELKVPQGTDVSALRPLLPVFAAYVMSFLYVAIYWNNHHHLMHLAERVSGGVLWANMHLLFWLSLIPFATGWARENEFEEEPTALYGIVLFGCAGAWWILQRMLAQDEKHETLRRALGRDYKGKLSLVLYAVAIPLSFVFRRGAIAIYVAVAILWLIPDRRFEKVKSNIQQGA